MAEITGVAVTPVGVVPEITATDLYALAIRGALADAQIQPDEIDLLVTGNSRAEPFMYHAEAMAEHLGMTPECCFTFDTGGATTLSAIAIAAAMIDGGQCRHAVIAMADSLATGVGRAEAIQTMATVAHPLYEQPIGPSVPSLYALIATRYMHHFDVTSEAVAAVSVSDRSWAQLNPEAQLREPITARDVVQSRLIADPLHVLDCSPVSDGGCAIVLSSEALADRRSGSHVSLLGVANASTYEHISQATSFTATAAKRTSQLALARSGRTLENIDVAMIYDAFSFMMCLTVEDVGFCQKGEGADFVAAGETQRRGRLPTNTHGGVLSHSHAGRPSALFLVVEAARQLRGECAERQVSCETALVHASGGVSSSHGTMILGRDV